MHDGSRIEPRRTIDRVLFGSKVPLVPGMEAVYQRIVQRELCRLKVEDQFYPLGAAANYGLLYIILRAVSDFSLKKVVELGAGQTSLVLKSLVAAGALHADVYTVEHDPHWAERIGRSVSHSMI